MTTYELKFSNLLTELTEHITDFIKTAYSKDNDFYVKQNQEEVQEEIQKETLEDNSNFENVDNSKIELIEYGQQSPSINKTLLWVIGGIILYNLIRGK